MPKVQPGGTHLKAKEVINSQSKMERSKGSTEARVTRDKTAAKIKVAAGVAAENRVGAKEKLEKKRTELWKAVK